MNVESIFDLRISEDRQITDILVLPAIPNSILDEIDAESDNHPLAVSCRQCEVNLPRQSLDRVLLPVDNYRLYFGPLPGYQCEPCDLVYLRSDVLERLSPFADAEMKKHNPPHTFSGFTTAQFNLAELAP